MEIILTKAENHALETCKAHFEKTNEVPNGGQLAFLLELDRSRGYHYIRAFCELGIMKQVKQCVYQWTDISYQVKVHNRTRGKA
ncbi:hypothetical protein C942_00266 [Photobacterium marinum]|uniref:Uncharacterized protein n=1 Tax=Photobacterium marinum TaxID=1056511 RepID=L8JI87_9GAMM|nr:hypothetical protein [Photobacterium marinum]ELR67958.1 hypothetical protein C942_00266 [Photobacterium marinum]